MSRRSSGFTLVELAVVLAIVGLLLGSLMYTLSAQSEQRNFEETRRRLEQARELVLGFAIAKGRLPCPATAASLGDEAATAGTCTTYYGGWLPARALGYQHVDANGFAVDAWGNPLRYAVAQLVTGCSGTPANPHFVVAANMKANGLACQPNDLLVCKSSTGITGTTCGTAFGTSGENQITTADLVVAVVFSTGKNGAAGGAGADELANLNGDRIFVYHTPTPSDAANGEFDDQMLWIPVGELYGKLVSAGILP
jgi:prepilin-type N-terminal cleavage/methylation domain-containing protein